MFIEHREEKGTYLVYPSGKIVLKHADEFGNYVRGLIDNGEVKGLIVNFANVESIDSSGIGALIGIFRSLDLKKIKMILCNVTPKIQEMFDISNLTRVMIIVTAEQEARNLVS